jgi:uncharacterized protein YecE (DUF72 family)
MSNIKFGTCSWNYDSWLELVYSEKSPTAAGYLKEYSQKYRTVEVDSWFYKMPARDEIIEYKKNVDNTFSFTCKIPASITLTHLRNSRDPGNHLIENPTFLSKDLFKQFLAIINPLLSQIDGLIFEFEYLNKEKMKSLDKFLNMLDTFCTGIECSVPLAIEVRNQNYLQNEYFQLLKDRNLIHVFSEKEFMPHIYEVYNSFKEHLIDKSIIRLLGGNRTEIEKKTGNKWNQLVDIKHDKEKIITMVNELNSANKKIIVNINNHYEGSAPKTIEILESMLQ